MRITSIRMVRMLKGLKLYELARESDLGESLLSRIETGRIIPNDDQLKRLSKALKVPLSTLTQELCNETLNKLFSLKYGKTHDK